VVKHVYRPPLTIFAVNADSQRQLTCYPPVKAHLTPLAQSVGSVARRGMNIRDHQNASGHDASRSPEHAHLSRCRNFATNAATASTGPRAAGNAPSQPDPVVSRSTPPHRSRRPCCVRRGGAEARGEARTQDDRGTGQRTREESSSASACVLRPSLSSRRSRRSRRPCRLRQVPPREMSALQSIHYDLCCGTTADDSLPRVRLLSTGETSDEGRWSATASPPPPAASRKPSDTFPKRLTFVSVTAAQLRAALPCARQDPFRTTPENAHRYAAHGSGRRLPRAPKGPPAKSHHSPWCHENSLCLRGLTIGSSRTASVSTAPEKTHHHETRAIKRCPEAHATRSLKILTL
jgi:hypothetical protein